MTTPSACFNYPNCDESLPASTDGVVGNSRKGELVGLKSPRGSESHPADRLSPDLQEMIMTPLRDEIEPALATALAAHPDVPLQVHPGGAVRVRGTRINLDTVIEEHGRGSTPEEIARAYDVLRVEDVRAVLAFYTKCRPQVDEYLARREAEAKALYDLIIAAQSGRPNLLHTLKASQKPQEPR